MSPVDVSRPPGFAAQGIIKIGLGFGQAARDACDLDGAGRRARLANELFQVPFAFIVPVSSSAGAVQFTPGFGGPGAGYYWSVRRLSVQGYSAGTVLVYKNAPVAAGAVVGTPEVFIPFPVAATATIGRSEGLLNPGDSLTVACTGITVVTGYGGVQVNGTADCFPSWLLPDYIM